MLFCAAENRIEKQQLAQRDLFGRHRILVERPHRRKRRLQPGGPRLAGDIGFVGHPSTVLQVPARHGGRGRRRGGIFSPDKKSRGKERRDRRNGANPGGAS